MHELVEKAEAFFKANIPASRTREAYLTHVELVRKYAAFLANEYDADVLVLEVAALLHDVGSDSLSEHAKKGAEMVRAFLLKLNFVEEETIDRIVSAIRNHSTQSDVASELPLEDQLLRDADAIAFLEETYRPFLERLILKQGKEDAVRATLERIKAMLDKVASAEGRKLAEKFYPEAEKYIRSR